LENSDLISLSASQLQRKRERERERKCNGNGNNGRESTKPRSEVGDASGGSLGRSGATVESHWEAQRLFWKHPCLCFSFGSFKHRYSFIKHHLYSHIHLWSSKPRQGWLNYKEKSDFDSAQMKIDTVFDESYLINWVVSRDWFSGEERRKREKGCKFESSSANKN